MPPPVTGYQAWWDATQIVGGVDGGALTSWDDVSGHVHHLNTSAGSGGTGIYHTTGPTIHGNPVVYFGGGSSNAANMRTPSFTLASPLTLLVVANQPAGAAYTQAMAGDISQLPAWLFGGTFADPVPGAPMLYDGGAGNYTFGTSAPAAVPHTYVWVFDGAATRCYVDGVANAYTPTTPTPVNFGITTGFELGSEAGANGVNTSFGEVILYGSALSPADVASLASYLATKWGTSPPPGGGPTGTAAVNLGPLTVAAAGAGPAVTGTAVLNIGPLAVQAETTLETRTGTAHVAVGPLAVVSLAAGTGPGAHPVPGYRSRWRLTLHNRAFAPATLAQTIIAEITDARGRRLDQAWNTPATLTFTLDGRGPSAALIAELYHDVVAWRWDDRTGIDVPVFRGPVTGSQDQLSEQSHVVTYTCHDYTALLARRLVTGAAYSVTGRDQDLIVGDLLDMASSAFTSGAISLLPASYLPISLLAVDGGGSPRGLSGRLRDRTYYPSQNVGTAVDDLAKAEGGYDYDVIPSAVDDHDSLRVFYPAQGVTRSDITLQYGSTVATVTRSVDSASYANFIRVLGNNSSANPMPQLFSEGRTVDAATTTAGLWMLADDASNVTVANTLADKARGDLALYALLVPAYTLGLAPDAYAWAHPNLGDTVPLVVQSGRLNVISDLQTDGGVRVVGISYAIGDDGQEDVTLTVARPPTSLAGLLGKADQSVKALAQR